MKTIQLSFSLPSNEDLSPILEKIKEKISVMYQMMNSGMSSFSSASADVTTNSRSQMRKWKRFIKESKSLPFIIVGIIFVILLVFGIKKVLAPSKSVAGAETNANGRVELRKPMATEDLKKQFSFPLKDNAGKEVSSIKLLVQNVELRDQIIIQGKIANTTVGKNVLIINLELTNNFTKPIQINSRNYFRLKKNNDGKLYDPKIHNDPLDVQPVSTTTTRVGFTVDDTDHDFILRVGDVTDPAAKTQEIKITNLR